MKRMLMCALALPLAAHMAGAAPNDTSPSGGAVWNLAHNLQIPEPATMLLIGTGLVALGFARRHIRRS